MSDHKTQLIALLSERSVRFGTFTLKSGKTSDLYIDARQTTLHPLGSALIAQLILARLRPGVVGVGGPVSGADPIAGAVAAISSLQGPRPVAGFMVRKEPKGHGTRLWVEGMANLPAGSPVCVIEDTTTTGGSLLRAIQHIEAAGLVVAQCITVVDRSEGATEALAAAGYTLEALVSRQDLVR
jgi:orotate phosphoribosyltransferase